MRELPAERFQECARSALERAGIDLSPFPPEYVDGALATCAGKVRTFAELPAYCSFYFRDDFEYDVQAAAKHFIPANRQILTILREAFDEAEDFDAAALEARFKTIAASMQIKVGALVHPTRLAMTGTTAGPSLYHLLEILGKEKVLARMDRALQQIALADERPM